MSQHCGGFMALSYASIYCIQLVNESTHHGEAGTAEMLRSLASQGD